MFVNRELELAIENLCGSTPPMIREQGFTRWSTPPGKTNLNGWAKKNADGSIAFGCWKRQTYGYWRDGDQLNAPVIDFDAIKRAEDAEVKRRKRNGDLIRAVWNLSKPLDASVAHQYLMNRGLHMAQPPANLRSSRAAYWEDGREIGEFDTLVARVQNVTGETITLHRTFLTPVGWKAPVACPRKMMPTSGPMAGCAVRLHAPALLDGRVTLGIAEGIETALAATVGSGVPCWSALNAGMLERFQWPAEVESLIVFGDNDTSGVGQRAARALAARACAAGLKVRVLIPPNEGNDWLDVVNAGGAV